MTLEELSDRESIRDVVYRYCHAIDRRDPEMLKNVYWPDATDDHGFMHSGVDEFVKTAMEMVGACVVTQHNVGNILIHLEGDSARVESYVNTYQRMEGPSKHWRTKSGPVPESQRGKFAEFFTGSRYIDRMQKRNGVWRISERTLVQDWYRIGEGQSWDNYPYPGETRFGTHGHDDPGYRLFEKI